MSKTSSVACSSEGPVGPEGASLTKKQKVIMRKILDDSIREVAIRRRLSIPKGVR